MSLLAVKRISKSFGKTLVLDNISLEVASGELCVVLGPSGCGKSTLLNIISGLESPSMGEIWLDGKNITEVDPAQRNMAFVFQSYALYPHLNIFDNISFSLKLQKLPKTEMEERVNRVAQKLQLQELLDRMPAQLSGGQRQRVAMGRAIIRHPKVFLFDEPLSNLDVALRHQMRLELVQLHKEQQAISLYVTHDQHEAMTMADKILVLNQGHIEQLGTPKEVYEQPNNLFVAQFIGHPQLNLLPTETIEELPNSVPLGSNLGIRPEKLHILEAHGTAPQGAQILACKFIRSEFPGGEYHYHFMHKENPLCVRSHRSALQPARDTTLYFLAQDAMVFEPRLGKNIGAPVK